MMTAQWLEQTAAVTATMKKDEKVGEFKKYKMKHWYKGEEMSLKDLSNHADCVVGYQTLRDRVKSGWRLSAAVTTRQKKGNHLTND